MFVGKRNTSFVSIFFLFRFFAATLFLFWFFYFCCQPYPWAMAQVKCDSPFYSLGAVVRSQAAHRQNMVLRGQGPCRLNVGEREREDEVFVLSISVPFVIKFCVSSEKWIHCLHFPSTGHYYFQLLARIARIASHYFIRKFRLFRHALQTAHGCLFLPMTIAQHQTRTSKTTWQCEFRMVNRLQHFHISVPFVVVRSNGDAQAHCSLLSQMHFAYSACIWRWVECGARCMWLCECIEWRWRWRHRVLHFPHLLRSS